MQLGLVNLSWWEKITKKITPSPSVKLATVRAGVRHGMLMVKRDFYILESKEVRDGHGFIHGCDSLLFSSLSRVGGYPVNLAAAEVDGRWYRTPNKDCFSSGRSKSTISRDQLIGMIWASYVEKDVSRLHRFFSYSEAHKWVVGDGVLSRTFVTPQIQRLAADVLDKLGGGNHRLYRQLPQIYPSGLRGFEAHLQILQILLYLHMDGKISKSMADRIHEHHARNPYNSLFSIAYHLITDGQLGEPTDQLLGFTEFPNARLPDNRCRSTEYLFERERDHNWQAKPEAAVYSGSDLIFAAGLIKLFSNR